MSTLIYQCIALYSDEKTLLLESVDDEALCDAPGHGGHDEGGAHVVRSVREGPKKLDLSIL